ncbi:hypothetical protein [Flavivirga jejuensis]|uniref:Uncharacterized protein n=1 Tax=Flavivirga jejuensis TaxID=870487 RepID=A0ABT8WM27_9FLAO|nr:hypothetical protein [Flavivirga jejuensis]MDO5974193.1 hypothetical protein [Flavivirga jejuensis]
MFLNYKELGVILFSAFFMMSCSDDDNSDPTNNVNFEEALLNGFPLSEIDITLKADSFSIEQPTMLNGIPQEKGKITIELENTDISKFSLKQIDFDASKFNISPAVGEQSIIPGETITYVITSTKDTNVSLQYDVLVIVKDIHPALQKLNIKKLHFLKIDNPSLDQDITSIEVREHTGQPYSGTIMVIVPDGTDFSSLIPTLDHEGSSVKYTTEHYGNYADFKVFDEKSKIDFKFPNIIAFQIYNIDETRYLEYRVLVDVKKLVTFDEEFATINNGSIVAYDKTYNNVLGFTYHGNYPINNKLSSSEIEVTETPENPSVNYYFTRNISLMEDNPSDNNTQIQTNERGRLYISLNFPFNFSGNDNLFITSATYGVKVTFSPMLNSYSTPNIEESYNNITILKYLNFLIYDPIEIEVKANVNNLVR